MQLVSTHIDILGYFFRRFKQKTCVWCLARASVCVHEREVWLLFLKRLFMSLNTLHLRGIKRTRTRNLDHEIVEVK